MVHNARPLDNASVVRTTMDHNVKLTAIVIIHAQDMVTAPMRVRACATEGGQANHATHVQRTTTALGVRRTVMRRPRAVATEDAINTLETVCAAHMVDQTIASPLATMDKHALNIARTF